MGRHIFSYFPFLIILALISCSDNEDNLLSLPEIAASTYHLVNPDGTGDFVTINEAIIAAANGDTIALSSGVHTKPDDTALYMGEKNLVIISVAANADSCIVDGESHSRRYAFLNISSGQDNNTRIEHITFRNFIHTNQFNLGAVFEIRDASPVISHCVFKTNAAGAGAAAYVRQSAARFEHCLFQENQGLLWETNMNIAAGGALYFYNSPATILDCIFKDNSIDDDGPNTGGGGAIGITGTIGISIYGSEFLRNSSHSGGGGIFCFGSTVTINGCQFSFNESGMSGGGIILTAESTGIISNCDFENNSAYLGGGLYCSGNNTLSLSSSRFFNNEAQSEGGAATIGCESVIDACVFWHNKANSGGAISFQAYGFNQMSNSFVLSNEAAYHGGAIEISGFHQGSMEVCIDHCTLWNNTAAFGGGAVDSRYASVNLTSCTLGHNQAPLGSALNVRYAGLVNIANSVIVENAGSSAINTEPQMVTIGCSNIWNNSGGDYSESISEYAHTAGNISAPPLFCDQDNFDFCLEPESPCSAVSSGCGIMGAWAVGCGSESCADYIDRAAIDLY